MNDEEQNQFEARLRECSPAQLPEQLMTRIFTGQSISQPMSTPQPRYPARWLGWLEALRWLAPATAAVILALGLWIFQTKPAVAKSTGLRADGVQVNQRLASSFDVVAQSPSGEPIRWRVRKWEDQVALNDKARGLVVKETVPRWEIVPIRVETY